MKIRKYIFKNIYTVKKKQSTTTIVFSNFIFWILYFGFSQILIELKIKARLDIHNIKDIIEYVNIHEKLNKQLDIQNLLLLVDNLKFENKIVFQM